MITITTASVLIGLSFASAAVVALFFLASQLSLAYATSGAIKVGHPNWRNGVFLTDILSTNTFGNGRIFIFFNTHKPLAALVSNSVVFGELLLSFAPWVPPSYCFILLGAGACFHVGVAFVMGLNTFPFAFGATFPAAIYVSLSLYR